MLAYIRLKKSRKTKALFLIKILNSLTLIVKGKKSIADVPAVIKEQVKQILIDLEVPELAEEQEG